MTEAGILLILILVVFLTYRVVSTLRRKSKVIIQKDRPMHWAQPMDIAGVTNCFRVDEHLLRGAQPTEPGMVALEKLGVQLITSLRGFSGDSDLIENTSLIYKRIRFHTWHPEVEDMVEFLKTINAHRGKVIFVHCRRGIDRTGSMVALYRIVFQGWLKEEALNEMVSGGFGYDDKFPNVVDFMRQLNVDLLCKLAGIERPPVRDHSAS